MSDLGKKISVLPETTDLNGLYTIGTDKNTTSKKVSLQFLKEAATYANAQGDYAKSIGDTVAGNVGSTDYPVFSASGIYAIGDVVRYNDRLYRFTAPHQAGSWTGADVELTSINEESQRKLTELANEVFEDDFELGNISIGTTGWGYNDTQSRVRTKKGTTYYLGKGCKIGLSDYTNARYYIGWKNAAGYKAAGWLTADYEVTEEGEYIVLICNKNDKVQTDKYALLNLLRIEGSLYVVQQKLKDIQSNVKKIGLAYVPPEYQIVNIDTTKKVIDFGQNSILIIGTSYYLLEDKARAIPYYVDGKNSGATYIVFNIATSSIYPKVYTEALTANEVLLGGVRSRYQTHEFISASFPWDYSVDGVNVREAVKAISADIVNPFVKGINHRGYNTAAPENTLPAYKKSFEQGFKYVEADVRFTSDNVGVLLHESSIDNVSNGSGEISAMTYANVSAYDFGSWFSSEFVGTRIATLHEFLAFCRNKGIHPYLEIKAGTPDQVASIVKSVSSYGMKGNVTYISFSLAHLQKVAEIDEYARLGYVVNTITTDDIDIAVSLRNGKNDVFIDAASYESGAIALCKNAGIPLEVWNINSETAMQGLDDYISGVTSDSYDFRKIVLAKN